MILCMFTPRDLQLERGWPGVIEGDTVVQLAAQTLAVKKSAESAQFARQFLHRDKPLGRMPSEKLNVNGGAIALGHPVGATGARIVLTSLKELHRLKAKRALATLCVGGGQGAALWLERN